MLAPPPSALRHYLTGPTCSLEFILKIRTVLKKVSSKRITQRLRSILALEEQHVPNIPNTPILLLQAEQDEVIPWEKQNQLEQHLPHAQIHWLESPHLIFQVHPKISARIILEFLDNI